jgi:3-hydroxyacyl-[acyl-carrier-protein] dehydratase
MNNGIPAYPFALQRQAIENLLPHRGDIFACQHLVVHGPHHFTGSASWPLENSFIRGHFPGLPVVPGVLLIEAMAQLAGAGLLSGDPYARSLPGDMIGVLASIRKCAFTHPVVPESLVEFEIQCRQMGPMAVQVSATVHANNAAVAQLEALIAYTDRAQLVAVLGGAEPPQALSTPGTRH